MKHAIIALSVIFVVVLSVLVVVIVHLARQVVYWREKAMAEAKKRLAKDEKTNEIRRAIDRGAAKLISEKDAKIRELQEQLHRKTVMNARLWEQLRDLKAGGEFDDE